MGRIHPTAIIGDGAQIADDAVIGPYCTVSSEAVIGSGTELISHVVIEGNTTLGANNRISPFAVLGGRTQVTEAPFPVPAGRPLAFVPAPDEHGRATFTFAASDGKLTSEPARVMIAVVPENDPPVAAADEPSTKHRD